MARINNCRTGHGVIPGGIGGMLSTLRSYWRDKHDSSNAKARRKFIAVINHRHPNKK